MSVIVLPSDHTQEIPVVNGLVLSGGQSSRMGIDKGEIHYHNINQRRYLFELLSNCCKATFISCNAEQLAHMNGLPFIKDVDSNMGPIAGLLSAFSYDKSVAWLVVACDFPFITRETIDYLIAHRNPLKTATAFLNTADNLPEPFITIWEPGAFPFLLQEVEQGNNSPRKALMNGDTELIQPLDKFSLKNVNTKEEYKEALSILQSVK